MIPESVILSRRAQLQFDLIVDYISDLNPTAGARLVERFAGGFRQLAAFPLSGARGKTPSTRRLIVAPYVLTYRARGEEVIIIDIRDGRQRETSIPNNLP